MPHRIQSLLIIAAVIGLDRWSKLYIQNEFGPFDSVPVIPGLFHIVHAENPGAAFSMLADAPSEWRTLVLIGISGVVMAVVAWMLFGPDKAAPQGQKSHDGSLPDSPMTRFGLALVLGGALGNMWDRVLIGTVTDFLQVFIPLPVLGSYEFPSFNVADSAITIGAFLLLLDMWRQRNFSSRRSSGTGTAPACSPEGPHE